MDAYARAGFGSVNDFVTIEVRRRMSQVDGIRRAQSVLRFGVWVCIDYGGLDTIVRSCLIDTS